MTGESASIGTRVAEERALALDSAQPVVEWAEWHVLAGVGKAGYTRDVVEVETLTHEHVATTACRNPNSYNLRL